MNIDGLQEYKKKIEEINKLIENTIKPEIYSVFSNYVQSLGIKYPFLENIHWDQYTPSFDDGDVPTFRSVDPEYSLSEKFLKEISGLEECYDTESMYLHLDDRYVEKYLSGDSYTIGKSIVKYAESNKELVESFNKEFDEFCNIFYSIDSDIMKIIFGDLAKVTITRDGVVTIEDYEYY